MKILIFGTGGVGGYFGSRLLQAGNKVVFVARGNHFDALKENGVLLKSFLGDYHERSIDVVDDLSLLDTDDFDLVLITCKWDDLEDSAKSLAGCSWSKSCFFLPLLNGIENLELLNQYLPENQVLGGLCRIIAYIESPGVIFHEDVIPSIFFGNQNNEKQPDLSTLELLFKRADIKGKWVEDIHLEIWKKFAFICSVSALGALVRMPIGSYRKGYLRVMIESTLQEIVGLAMATGIDLGETYAQDMLGIIDKQDANSTASLQRDLMDGRPSELNAQNGAIIRLAHKHGVKVPMNQLIFQLLKPQENFNRAKKK